MSNDFMQAKFANPNEYDTDTRAAIVNAVKECNEKQHAPISIMGGCGRVYVWIGYKSLRANSKLAKELQAAGVKVTRSPSSSGMQIYAGYDNADGLAAAKGESIQKAIKAINYDIPCGVDYQAD